MAPIKIGELLIQEGLITSDDLEEALKAQIIFGGRLGSNLIEMGVLEEEDIARVLSRKLKVPFIEPDELTAIPQPVLDLIPRELAERHKVIPLRLESRRLTLGMANPADLKAIDEIAFRTGLIIRPVVTPELRLIQALERHYGIPRDLRWIPFHNKLPRKRQPSEAIPAPAAAVKAAAPEIILDLDDVIVEEQQASPGRLDLETAARRLAEAGDRDQIAELAVACAARLFHRAALFLVRSGSATGWRAMRNGSPVVGFDLLRIPLNEPSALKSVAETCSCFLGPLPQTAANSRFQRELGVDEKSPALLLPMLLMGRVIAILYLDGEAEELRENLQDLQKLVAKMIMALEILILKNKILML